MTSLNRRSRRRGARRGQENTQATIDNPLADLNPDELTRSAESFARRIDRDTPDIKFWNKAAQVARYQQVPYMCERIRGLSSLEQKAIREQRDLGFWRQPKPLRITIVTLCLAAIIQGWAQTGLNGANLTWGKQLGLTEYYGPPTTTREVWIFAAINSVLYFSASILGCWFSDPLQSLIIGRRGAIFFSACLCLAGATGCAFSQTWLQLFGCRVVLGAAMGAKASVTPIYGAEVSPTHLRGALVMNWQLFSAFGIFLGFAANLIVSKTGDNRWRYELASVSTPTVCLLSLIWTIPESPRWLLKKGRYADAYASFCAIRETPLQAAAELFYANAQIQAEIRLLDRKTRQSDEELQNAHAPYSHGIAPERSRNKIELREYNHRMSNGEDIVSEPMQVPRPNSPPDFVKRPVQNSSQKETQERSANGCLPLPTRLKQLYNAITDQKDDVDLEEYQRCAKSTYYVTRIWQLFQMPRIRRATVAASIMMIAQQMCGINILQFYSTTFFHDPDLTSDSMLGPGLSLGFGLANFLFTFPVYAFIDKRGRRFLLLSSYPGMILSMLGACLAYNIRDDTRRLVVLVLFMFLFVFFYSWGQGPVPFAYASEVFPLLNREAGMSFSVFVNLFGAGVVALFVPQLTQALASHPQESAHLKTGESRLLGIFTGLNVVALVLIFFFVPETAGATLGSDEAQGLNFISLEELNYIFNVKTNKHISYQVKLIVPWAWKVLIWKLRGAQEEIRPKDPSQLYIWAPVCDEESDREVGNQRENSD